MSEDRDASTGQFTSTEESRFGFGEGALEHDAGYKPMPRYKEEPAESEVFDTPREAAEAFAGQGEPEIVPVQYFDKQTGEPLNENLEEGPIETVTLEQAAADLTAYRNEDNNSAAWSISNDFAAAVDQRRAEAIKDNPALAEELGIDPPPKGENFEDNKKSGEKAADNNQPDPFDSIEGLEPETREALKRPQVRQFLESNAAETEQAVQSLKVAVSHNQTFGQAAILALAPELAQVPLDRWAEGINILAQSDPARGRQLATMFDNVAALNQRQQVVGQYQQEVARQNFEAQRAEYSAKSDEVLGPMTRAEKAEMMDELVNYAGKHGLTRDQFAREAATNLAIHHPFFTALAADAIRYQRLMQAPKAVSTKTLPPVQRPGVSRGGAARGEDLSSLSQRLNQSGDYRDAAALLIAQRKARG